MAEKIFFLQTNCIPSWITRSPIFIFALSVVLSVVWLILMYHLIVKCSGTKPVAHPVGLPGAGAPQSAVVAPGGDVQGSALLSGVEPPPKEFCLNI